MGHFHIIIDPIGRPIGHLFSDHTNVTSHNNRNLMSIFENVEIFKASKRVFNKISNDFNFWKIELQLLKIMRKRRCQFLIIFFIFYKLFRSISLNKPGRHKVPFVVMHHKYTVKI